MMKISEAEFAKICLGIDEEREKIYRYNPLGTEEETLLWMLLSILISYLSIDEKEIPCFPNSINAETYRTAILFILKDRQKEKFEAEKYLEKLCS